MDKPYFRLLSSPKLEEPVFVAGLLGFGAVGNTASRMLIDAVHAELFAELYTPWFPDYVTVEKDGICRVPHYEFYAADKNKPQLIILTGNAQPPSEDIKAYYELCDTILTFAEQHGCKFLITLDGMSTPKPTSEVYVAATSPKLASETAEKGAAVYGHGKILGAPGPCPPRKKPRTQRRMPPRRNLRHQRRQRSRIFSLQPPRKSTENR